jgi:hypothetical protein
MAFALLVTFHAGKIPPFALRATLGTFLLAWGIFTGYMTMAATTLSRLMLIVFVLLTIAFFILAIANFTSQAGLALLPWAIDGDRSLVRVGDHSHRIHPKALNTRTSQRTILCQTN